MRSADVLIRAGELASAGEPFALATVVSVRRPASARRGDRAVVTAGGEVYGWVGGSCSEPTVVREAGLVVEDFGGEGSFVPPGRERTTYIGKSPKGRPADLTFGFRPVRDRYFHEDPRGFETPGLLYHPVKPGVAAWTRESMNLTP